MEQAQVCTPTVSSEVRTPTVPSEVHTPTVPSECNFRLTPPLELSYTPGGSDLWIRKIEMEFTPKVGMLFKTVKEDHSKYVDGYSNIGASIAAFKNFQRDVKGFIGSKDGQLFVDTLQKLSDTHKGFYYVYDKNNEDNLAKVFWCDAQARKNYALFGDTISYDPTYGTNKYYNHKKSITFSVALLSNDDEQLFRWFIKRMCSVVWDSNLEPTEFEEQWCWIPAYFRDMPMRGVLRTTQRSESTNSFFKRFENQNGTLGQQCLNEASDSLLPQTITPLEIKKHASTIFTHAVFYEFQEEVKASVCVCGVAAFTKDMNIETTDITDAEKGKIFTVLYNCATHDAKCSCKLFEQKGKRLKKIPEKYIMGRWTKNVYKKPIYEANGDLMEEYDVTDIKKIELSNVCESEMRELAELIKRFRGKINPGETSLTKDQEIEMLLGCTAPSEVSILPPKRSNNNGSGKRMLLDKAKNIAKAERPKRLCANCKQMVHHDRRNCPVDHSRHGFNLCYSRCPRRCILANDCSGD
ncbi:hypothetical protein RND81_09G065700 [Saponaria officinalis]|uniref:Protein FAR1-RELATED SEQUENCE n=1 Tax=Saponaria officinalis TaxID=3572 RepID=A0AAW1IIU1_SAPOF